MPLQVVIPDNDPLIRLLEKRAVERGFGDASRKAERAKLRKRLPKLARTLISERLSQLETEGDPMRVEHALPVG